MDSHTVVLQNEIQPIQQIFLPDSSELILDKETSILTPLTPVEPSVTIPKPPQEMGAYRSNSHGEPEAADSPSGVVAPNPSIPPHLMGRDLNHPEEDVNLGKRKLQKPRPGVKVPYRNLTSQIVTQEEIAQEIYERNLKKNPTLQMPPQGDIFFAKKLTQRLANRLSPAMQNISNTSAAETEIKVEVPQSFEASRSLPTGLSIVPQPASIPDHSDLLAILEGDDVGDWMPGQKQPVKDENLSDTKVQFRLDPAVERELALKQLKELPVRARKRHAHVTHGLRAGRGYGRRKEMRKFGKRLNSRPILFRNVGRGNVDNMNEDINYINMRRGVKRKMGERTYVSEPKIFRASRNEVEPKHSLSVKPITKLVNQSNAQQDIKLLCQSNINNNNNNKETITTKVISNGDIAQTVHNLVPNPGSTVAQSEKKTEVLKQDCNAQMSKADLILKEGIYKTVALIRQKIGITSPLQNKLPDIESGSPSKATSSNENNLGTSITPLDPVTSNGSLNSSVCSRFSSPPKTYSTKRKFFKSYETDTLSTDEVSQVLSSHMLQIPVASEVQGDASQVSELKNNVLPRETEKNSVLDESATGSVTQSENGKKKYSKRMKEIDKLLMDEGAINLLYEAEHGDSKRRSGTQGSLESTGRHTPLPSIRRKKKDLLLKAKLVKNAVLRLSNSPNLSPAASVLKGKRFSEPPVLHASERDPLQYMSPQRKRSIDSRDSLCSPTSSTPLDPPSPSQNFSYTPELQLTAEASRIIRRHSSSSNFSSRSTSPNTTQRMSVDQDKTPDCFENGETVMSPSISRTVYARNLDMMKQSHKLRRKGVPIFVRKSDAVKSFKGKKKVDRQFEAARTENVTSDEKKLKIKNSNAEKAESSNKHEKERGKAKLDLKPKNESVVSRMGQIIDNRDKSMKTYKINKIKGSTRKMPELSACLAEAVTAFAAQTKKTEKSSSKSLGKRNSKISPYHQQAGVKAVPVASNISDGSTLPNSLDKEDQNANGGPSRANPTLRSIFRHDADTSQYKEICVRRLDNIVQIILNPVSTQMTNAFNVQVLQELKDALYQLKHDKLCKVILFTSTGNTFCQGVDLSCLIHSNVEHRKNMARELTYALKEFLKCLAFLNKPLIAGVHNAAVGLGVTILPFFDMVLASDKATFSTPYCKLGQVPEGAATLTLPQLLGNAVTSEMLFGSRTLTACEALQYGLVTRILWHDKFQEELIPAVRSVATQSSQSMEATKVLLRHSLRTKLDAALDAESLLLVRHWASTECQTNFKQYLEEVELSLQSPQVAP